MKNCKIIEGKSPEIADRWFKAIIETYPQMAAKFFSAKDAPFSNPVGSAIAESARQICNWLTDDKPLSNIEKSLEELIKIRAVQDFTASEAVSFILKLKTIILELQQNKNDNSITYGELSEIFEKIDGLMLFAFDLFMRSREKIYEIKANEIKNQTYMLIERINKKYENND
ncbi:MAG: hypothetical protein QG635_2355 [Bacteroidota bacterium]|nr:hypothetical protein [Bacteroidota bacterium]